MRTFDGIAAARDAAQDFYYQHRADLPEHVEEKLAPLFRTGTSPVDAIVRTGEVIFANIGVLPKSVKADALDLGAGLAALRDQDGYHRDDSDPDRAAKISAALRRENGEKGNWPKADADPTPLAELRPPAPAEAPAAAPASE